MSTLSQILSSAKAASPDRPISQPVADLWEDVRAGYTEELGPHERTALQSWLGFSASFCTARGIAHAIKDQAGPFRNVSIGGRHIHHFVPGILLAFGSGTAALLTDDDKLEQKMAIPMGAGFGLTFDEAALLLDLRDVYWTREGLLSIQLSLGATAILSIAILTLRMLRRGERKAEQEGAIPPAHPHQLSFGTAA